MFSTKNERVAILVATIFFSVIALIQFWRGFTGIPVTVGTQAIPTWTSFIAGSLAVLMAAWLGSILKEKRPLI